MEIHNNELTDVNRYLEKRGSIRLDRMEDRYQSLMRCLNVVKPVTPETRMLEVGTGTGLFPIWCATRRLNCKGLEISPQLVAHARKIAAEEGVEIDMILGNLEDHVMPPGQFDVVVAVSLFEHVQNWRRGLHQIYSWLGPGGLLLFESTNKFSLTSGEYPKLPLYGWLPNFARYQFRQIVQGRDIMQLGIDFHQFTFGGLRKAFREIGFSQIYDRADLADASAGGIKGRILAGAKESRVVRGLFLTFVDTTLFVCVK